MALVARKDRPKPRKVYVSDASWREVRIHCLAEGVSVSAWIRKAIRKLKEAL